MTKINSKYKFVLKLLLIIFIAALLIFGIISLIWYINYSVVYKPLINNDKLTWNDGAYEYIDDNEFSDDKVGSYFYVNVPSFLDFGKDISSTIAIAMPIEKSDDGKSYETDLMRYGSVTIAFGYKKTMFGEQQFYWDIYDRSGDTSQMKDVEIYTNDKLELISQRSGNNCALTYDSCYEYIYDFYNTYLVEIFGEDCFPKLEN